MPRPAFMRDVESTAGSVSQVLIASALIAGLVACTIGFTESLQHPETPTLSDSWKSVAEQARRFTLPEEPTLIRDSPMQTWLKGREDIWGQGAQAVKQIVAGTVGDHKLRVLSGFGPFQNHKAERYLAYGFPPGKLGHASRHNNIHMSTLRSALEHVWATPRTPGTFIMAWLQRHVGEGSLVTESIDSIAPQLAEFMPEGCLRDDRFVDSGQSPGVAAELLRASDCRSISARQAPSAAPRHIAPIAEPYVRVLLPLQLHARREGRGRDGHELRPLPQPPPPNRRHQASYAPAPFGAPAAAPLPVLAR